jgi:hypothetical protein
MAVNLGKYTVFCYSITFVDMFRKEDNNMAGLQSNLQAYSS